ncbi:MAG: hypothetical protein COA78_08485 [Blastopirellula sp.]|nr:MAG: hypothetical protein COA78_08485 [Blastopirellula sp.]
MSQLDRAFIRAYTAESNNPSEMSTMIDQEDANVSAAQQTMNRQQLMLRSQGPTVEQIQHWQAKGMRVDLPGSPPMGIEEPSQSGSSTIESSVEPQMEKPQSFGSDTMFADASKNTQAVAKALEKIIQKAKQSLPDEPKQEQVNQVEHPAAEKQIVEEPAAIAPVPEPPVAEPMLQHAPVAKFQPRWEVPDFAWPEMVTKLMERGLEGYEDVSEYLMQQAEIGKKVVSIHSHASGVGCTTLALCLAKLFSDHGVRLALIDANLNHPSLAIQMGVQIEQGWEAVSGNYGKTPEEIAMNSKADNLTLIPLFNAPESGTSYAGLRQTISHIHASYDLIIVDVGCVDQFPQSLEFIDGAMIVRDIRTNTDEQITEVVNRLTSAGVPILGVTENFVD